MAQHPKFLTKKTQHDLIKQIITTDDDVCIAVAYWGYEAPEFLGLNNLQLSKIKIVCDLLSGACNPKVIQELLNEKFEVRTLDRLHAKVYYSRSAAVVTSANASTNGLGFQADSVSNVEAGIHVTDHETLQQIKSWFDEEVWSNARKITADTISEAQEKWKRNQNYLNCPTVQSGNATRGIWDLLEDTIEVYKSKYAPSNFIFRAVKRDKRKRAMYIWIKPKNWSSDIKKMHYEFLANFSEKTIGVELHVEHKELAHVKNILEAPTHKVGAGYEYDNKWSKSIGGRIRFVFPGNADPEVIAQKMAELVGLTQSAVIDALKN